MGTCGQRVSSFVGNVASLFNGNSGQETAAIASLDAAKDRVAEVERNKKAELGARKARCSFLVAALTFAAAFVKPSSIDLSGPSSKAFIALASLALMYALLSTYFTYQADRVSQRKGTVDSQIKPPATIHMAQKFCEEFQRFPCHSVLWNLCCFIDWLPFGMLCQLVVAYQ